MVEKRVKNKLTQPTIFCTTTAEGYPPKKKYCGGVPPAAPPSDGNRLKKPNSRNRGCTTSFVHSYDANENNYNIQNLRRVCLVNFFVNVITYETVLVCAFFQRTNIFCSFLQVIFRMALNCFWRSQQTTTHMRLTKARLFIFFRHDA